MKVTFLAEKYRVGTDRGLYAHEKKGILEDLNLVIDLKHSEYPKKWVETEDKKAYHETETTMDEFFEGRPEKKLEPGDMFVYDGQVLAIDRPDRLIVVVSESGPLAVQRFVEEILSAEVKMAKGDPEYGEGEIMMKEIETLPPDFPDDLTPYYIPYYTEKSWRDKTRWPKNFQVTFSTPLSFLPIRLFVVGNKVWGYPEEVEAEMIETLTAEFMSRSWNQVNDKTEEKETSLTIKD